MAKHDELLTRTLVELADSLVDDFDVVDLLMLLTERCCEAFGVSDAGIMLASPMGGELRVMASSSITMKNLELCEVQTSEGPCLDAYRSGEPVLNEDLDAAVERWPDFAPAAIAAGFRTVSALPMRYRGRIIGALNLFAEGADTLSDADVSGAQACADVATIAILQHQASVDALQVNDQLNHALRSRIILEQAKGMLAERANLDVDEAFVWLRSYARNHGRRLIDVAEDLLDGRLDTIDPPPTSPGPAPTLPAPTA